MFSKYRGGSGTSRAGRALRPTHKAQHLLAESMMKGFLAIYTQTICTSKDIDKLIDDKVDQEELQEPLSEWHQLREQLSNFHRDLPAHLGKDDMALCDQDMADILPFLKKLDTKVNNFLDSQDEDDVESLRSQTTALEEEISKLEDEYQKTMRSIRPKRRQSPSPSSRTPHKRLAKEDSKSPVHRSRADLFFGESPDRLAKHKGVTRTCFNRSADIKKERVDTLDVEVLLSVIASESTRQGFHRMLDHSEEDSLSATTSPSRSQSCHTEGTELGPPRHRLVKPSLNSLRRPPQEIRYRPIRPAQAEAHITYKGDYSEVFSEDASPGRLTAHAMMKLADAVLDAKNADVLPRVEPPVFGGDPLQYTSWWNSFKIMVSMKRLSDRQKLLYLYQYTKGAVQDMVEGYMNLDDDQPAYDRAITALCSRYGNRLIVAESYKQKIAGWPRIREGDGKGLARLSDFLWQCHHVMQGSINLEVLNTQEENAKIVSKLPYNLQVRWFRKADTYIHGNEIHELEDQIKIKRDFPNFHEFCKFVAHEARIITGTCAALTSQASSSRERNDRRSFLIESRDNPRSRSADRPAPRCSYCKEPHYLYLCEDFLRLPVPDKKEYALKRGLCFGCLRRGHRVEDCTIKNQKIMSAYPPMDAARRSSSSRHPDKPRSPVTSSEKATACGTRRRSQLDVPEEGHMYTYAVPVTIRCGDGKRVTTFAAVDNQSNCSFITKSLQKRLEADGEMTFLELTTMGSTKALHCDKIPELSVQGMGQKEVLSITGAYTRDEIPISLDCIPTRSALKRHEHLRSIEDQITQPGPDDKVEILIGYDCPRALLPMESLSSEHSGVFAVKTPLGWSVTGSEDRDPRTRLAHCYRTATREITHEQLLRAFDIGFEHPENDQGQKTSADDERFLKIITEGLEVTEKGKFQMPLPFREVPTDLPESRSHAVGNLKRTGKKMKKHPSYGNQYKEQMEKLIHSDQAERVPYPDDRDPESMWYWSHHGVFHPRKGKLRCVFNGSTKIKGVALNDLLLTGPDLTNNLVGVLLRFRLELFAILCDIEGMFHQVKITPWFRDYVRFVWFEDGDPDKPVVDYRMTVHLFGASSSPGCANFALKEAARRFEEKYGSDAAGFLRENFYVDDGLGSCESVEKASNLVKNSHEMCREGGFNLCKFDSNSEEVLRGIPENLRAKNPGMVELETGQSSDDCALGVGIDLKQDAITYHFTPKKLDSTRRGYLSGLSSVYDPLGLISPAILPGRIILQKLCADGLSWDETLDSETVETWEKWYAQLKDLKDIIIDRCVKSKLNGEVLKIELHVFVDASTLGLGLCIYLVQRTKDDFQSSLIFAKSKVAPLKQTTIPRMELQAAVLGVQAGVFIEKELMKGKIESHYYSDSKIVLAYISNLSLRCHMYVGNRASFIRTKTEPKQWRYVETSSNPADLASRGVTVAELRDSRLWWHGPEFLGSPHTTAPESFELSIDDPEVKKGQKPARCMTSAVKEVRSIATEVAERKSTWRQLLGVFVQLVKVFLKARKLEATEVEVVQMAENAIYRDIQRKHFPKERALLCETSLEVVEGRTSARESPMKPIPRSSKMYKLNPYMDSEGLLRVGGRLNNGDYPNRFKHPLILPAESRVTMLRATHIHQQAGHPGTNWSFGASRLHGLWIIKGKSLMSKITRECVACIRKRRAPMTQQMSALPEERLKESEPFVYSAVDLFGPFETKFSSRSVRKRWIALFVCLCSRAIHLEVVDSLDTCSFLNAYRRFAGRRGIVRVLWCDRGTNFVGGARAMEEERKILASSEIKQELKEEKCDWVEFKFNPPKASHMGGAWERMIRTVRSALFHSLSLHPHALSDDQFHTVVVEAEALVNSRPVSYVDSASPDDPVPLSPAQILTLKTHIAAPLPGVFQDTDRYARKRWKYVQYLASQFWDKWRVEIAAEYQSREKWQKPQPNLAVGDIVIMMEDETPRGRWPLALVTEAMPGNDGLVRKVKIRVRGTELERPIVKLIRLVIPDGRDNPESDVPIDCPKNDEPSDAPRLPQDDNVR